MRPEVASISKLKSVCTELEKAISKCDRALLRRECLPTGSSIARVTTANAKWRSASEHAERTRGRLVMTMARVLDEFGLLTAAADLRDQCPEFDGRHLEFEHGPYSGGQP